MWVCQRNRTFRLHELRRVGLQGILNITKHLGMLDGEINQQPCKVINETLEAMTVYANRGGMVLPDKKPGEKIAENYIILRILDMFGEEVEAVKCPINGYVVGYQYVHSGNQSVSTGDPLVYVGSPRK